jgi:signal transduction histidine kinase
MPFVAIQAATVVCVTAAVVWFSIQQVEKEIDSRLANVASTLRTADYRLTPAILNQLRKLSGAHFVVFDDANRPGLTTLAEDGGLEPNELGPLVGQIEDRRTTVQFGDETFFALRMRRRVGASNVSILILFDQTEWQAQRRAAIIPPLVVGSILLIAAIAASIVVSRRIGNRIARVQRQVVKIADGDFSPVTPPRTDDELRELAESVNRMAVILDESMRKIRETERNALLAQLVGGLAHQLRNAITGARISTQLHQRRCANGSDEALHVALQQLSLVEQQIKALLRVTRGETRSRVSGCVGEILDQTVALVSPLCEHQSIDLQFRREPGAWEIADADALRAALLNLMMNAVEAAGPMGTVQVNATADARQVTIDVVDDGPGIQNPEAIFEPFYSTKQEGVGLGLSLAKSACEECQGTLTHHRQNHRTTFRMTLPVGEMPLSTTTSATSAASFRSA